MHKEILNNRQLELLPFVKHFFESKYYLVGGTALALQLGHRESIDFDLFTKEEFDKTNLIKRIQTFLNKDLSISDKNITVQIDKVDNYTFLLNNAKITFFKYAILMI